MPLQTNDMGNRDPAMGFRQKRSKRQRRRAHPGTQQATFRGYSERSPNTYVAGVRCPQGARNMIIPRNKNQARFAYGNG
jgi:hypothetical protein